MKEGIRMNDIKRMSDEELDKAIESKYGEDWDPMKIPAGEPLLIELWSRVDKAG